MHPWLKQAVGQHFLSLSVCVRAAEGLDAAVRGMMKPKTQTDQIHQQDASPSGKTTLHYMSVIELA